MKRIIRFTDAMHNAFCIPLVTEDSYKDALRLHILAGLSGYDNAECYDIGQFEIAISYAFLHVYAEYRSNRISNRDALVTAFTTFFVEHVAEESIMLENEYLKDGNGKYSMFKTEPEYNSAIPGVQNLEYDDIPNVATSLGYSLVDALLANGNLSTYFDIALGYVYGESISLQGNSCFDTILIMDDSIIANINPYSQLANFGTENYTPPDKGRGTTCSLTFTDFVGADFGY